MNPDALFPMRNPLGGNPGTDGILCSGNCLSPSETILKARNVKIKPI